MFERTLKATLAAAMFGLAATSAQAGIVASVGGMASLTPDDGQISSICIGCTTVDFNSTALGALPGTYALDSGLGRVVVGTVAGSHAAPRQSPGVNNTRYLAVSSNGAAAGRVVITPGLGPLNYFGLWAGSIDTFNSISFYINGTTQVGTTFSGNDLKALPNPNLANGNQAQAAYFNFQLNGGDTYTSIVLGSTGIAFESDNHTFGSVVIPVPGAAALMLSGLFGLLFAARREKKAVQLA